MKFKEPLESISAFLINRITHQFLYTLSLLSHDLTFFLSLQFRDSFLQNHPDRILIPVTPIISFEIRFLNPLLPIIPHQFHNLYHVLINLASSIITCYLHQVLPNPILLTTYFREILVLCQTFKQNYPIPFPPNEQKLLRFRNKGNWRIEGRF